MLCASLPRSLPYISCCRVRSELLLLLWRNGRGGAADRRAGRSPSIASPAHPHRRQSIDQPIHRNQTTAIAHEWSSREDETEGRGTRDRCNTPMSSLSLPLPLPSRFAAGRGALPTWVQ